MFVSGMVTLLQLSPESMMQLRYVGPPWDQLDSNLTFSGEDQTGLSTEAGIRQWSCKLYSLSPLDRVIRFSHSIFFFFGGEDQMRCKIYGITLLAMFFLLFWDVMTPVGSCILMQRWCFRCLKEVPLAASTWRDHCWCNAGGVVFLWFLVACTYSPCN